jgi:hypothetical protein
LLSEAHLQAAQSHAKTIGQVSKSNGLRSVSFQELSCGLYDAPADPALRQSNSFPELRENGHGGEVHDKLIGACAGELPKPYCGEPLHLMEQRANRSEKRSADRRPQVDQ